ncbi:hypothetical protein FJY71_08715, partial [candidate division WOR-3 bacterium]|nr:hypothetical protein [candidate division WOR-3 bacterium]
MTRKHRPAPPAARPVVGPTLSDSRLNRVVIAVLFFLPFLFFLRYMFGGRMLFGTDFIGDGGYAAHQFMANYIKAHGAIAFWQPDILCGQPTVAAFFGDLFYPTILLRLILPVHIVWAWTFALHFFLAGLGTYLFLKEHKVGIIPAGLGGVAYMFAGSLVTLTFAGHDGRLIGSALLPLALFFLHRGMTRRQLIHFLLCGLVVGLQLLSGHVQKVYYTGLMLVAYFAFMLVRAVRVQRTAISSQQSAPSTQLPGHGVQRSALSAFVRLSGSFALGMALAGCLAAVQYLPIYGSMRFGARGGDKGYAYASSWSMHPAETFDLLTPRFSGAVDSYNRLGQYYQQAGIPIPPRAETYWGPNSFKLHSEYLGIIPLVFAIIAVFRLWRRREVKFFFFTFAGALVMAWGGHTFLYRLPYHLFPGVAKFRGPAMVFFVAAFSLVVLAGFGFSHVLSELRVPAPGPKSQAPVARRLRPVLFAGLVPLAVLLFLLLARDSAA